VNPDSQHTCKYCPGCRDTAWAAENANQGVGCLIIFAMILLSMFIVGSIQVDQHFKAIGHPLQETPWEFFIRSIEKGKQK
jgi:hypothetical protein